MFTNMLKFVKSDETKSWYKYIKKLFYYHNKAYCEEWVDFVPSYHVELFVFFYDNMGHFKINQFQNHRLYEHAK